jgi:DNA-binding transcriptional LysR family regulator
MEFRHLRYFLALAEELHFGRAAQRLSITQPPLSLNIQQLEASVGAQLFTRNSRGVQLTAAGVAFVPAARALLDQAGQAAREAREVAQGLVGSLQIGFAGTVLYRGLPQMLKGFASEHPKLRLTLRELSSSDQLIDLMHERLDVGFVHTTRVPAGFSQILVSRQPFVACLPLGHAMARRKRLALHAFSPEMRYELRHWLSVVSLVAQGLGVALVPAALQQANLPGAVFVPLAGETSPYETHCLWKTDRDQAALGAFLAVVRAAAQSVHSVG